MSKATKSSDDTKGRIVRAAGHGFRRRGYDGLGVDALAREAGVTSGAFYGHFENKAVAFRAALSAGLEELRAGIVALQGEHGRHWRDRFVDFYVTERRTCDLSEGCALQSLTLDAARADELTRATYEAEWIRVRDAAANGLSAGTPRDRRARATALLALLSGGVSIARAVRTPETSAAVADALRWGASALGGQRRRPAPKESSSPDEEAKAALVRLDEDAWNARSPEAVTSQYAERCTWRDRTERLVGPDAVRAFLSSNWRRRLDFRVVKEAWLVDSARIVVRFASEWRDDSGYWYRTRGTELFELDADSRIANRECSANDVPIREDERLLRWPDGARPAKHEGLSELFP